MPWPKKIHPKTFLFWSLALVVAILAFMVVVRSLKSRRIEEALAGAPSRIIARLSLAQKVGQLFHIGIVGTRLRPLTKRIIQKYKIGGVILFEHNFGPPDDIRALNTELQKSSVQASGIPLLISTDQEGGRVKRLGPDATVNFPSAMALGQTADPTYAEEVGFITGYELRQLGINWVLAPVLDVNNNPENPVINIRSFGSEPELVAKMGTAYVAGNRKALSLSAIKHFPGHGDTDIDSHLSLPRIDKSLAELQAMELLPFRQAIREGAAEVLMTAHILFPSLDSQKPATLSASILKKLLREKLGFQGLITTDAMEMNAISQRYSPASAARQAFAAGADVILLTKEGGPLHLMYRALLKDFESGRLPISELDQALKRQLSLKIRRGLLYRWKSPYKHKTASFQNYWRRLEQRAKLHYRRLQQKYRRRGVDLNTVISRDSITSLRRPFHGLDIKNLARVRLLVQSDSMRQQALRMGIPSRHIHGLKHSQDLLQILRRKPGEIWFAELRPRALRTWNRLIETIQLKERPSLRPTPELTIALYTGSPFLDIAVPQSGAVLVSCSDTPASRAALVYRGLLPQKPIPQTRLILPEIRE